ncbi:DUF5454 family protein [Leptospira sp. 201903071]|uniref:DUF5454 family protein n=1 Tax=Leptospira ainazelensis TaxID=2810034 RepID=UPI001966AD5D|nr:DUF5454 family protein [Leptospira ainazelensis]MBM9501229.1 DUF5454 family protein [Leptospira ainazelensis]
MKTKHRYNFGRINIIANVTDKNSFYEKGLNSKSKIDNGNNSYGFFDIRKFIHEDFGTIFEGYLVKYLKSSHSEKANTITSELEEIEIQNEVIEKSRFFIKVNTSIIIYHLAGGQDSNKNFCQSFSKLFEQNYENLLTSLTIDTISNEEKLNENISNFSSIHRVEITLRPSNPSFRNRWKKVDERLKDLKVKEYKEVYETKPGYEGISIPEVDDIRDKITMALDGYGVASVNGEKNGEAVTVSTIDNPITSESGNSDVVGEEVLDEMKKVINKVDDRLQHEDK